VKKRRDRLKMVGTSTSHALGRTGGESLDDGERLFLTETLFGVVAV
jgi:hypothetical protein